MLTVKKSHRLCSRVMHALMSSNAFSFDVCRFRLMFTPTGIGRGPQASSRSASASTPALLNPRRLMTARSEVSRKTRGFAIARLWSRRNRAELNKAKRQFQQATNGNAVLVETCCETDRVWKAESGDVNRS